MKLTLLFFLWITIFQRGLGQVIPDLDQSAFNDLVQSNGEGKKLVNFWASWCAPCMEELPYFSQYQKEHPDVEVVLVNLDFNKDVPSKVVPIQKMELYRSLKIVRINRLKADQWMTAVHNNWDGAIPATLLVQAGSTHFYGGKFNDYQDLVKFSNPH